jgi:broad specificity phosphatase PhoE
VIPLRLRLLLVRHGEAEANRSETFLGRTDSPLTLQGKMQATALATNLASEPIAIIYSSPLQRARHTAEAIAATHHCPVRLDDRLLEQDFGRWEGLSFNEAASRYPADFPVWQFNATKVGPPGGETLAQVAARQIDLYNELQTGYTAEIVVLVGHGGALNVLLCTLLHTPLRWLWPYRLALGTISEVLVYEQGAVLTRLSSI